MYIKMKGSLIFILLTTFCCGINTQSTQNYCKLKDGDVVCNDSSDVIRSYNYDADMSAVSQKFTELMTWKALSQQNLTDLIQWKALSEQKVKEVMTWKPLSEQKLTELMEWKAASEQKLAELMEWKAASEQNLTDMMEWKSVSEQKHKDHELQIAALKQQNEELKTIIKNLDRNITIREVQPRSCAEIHKSGQNQSGVYTLLLSQNRDQVSQQVDVYCDMETDGGGWEVFQRRQDGSVLFNRTWYDYKHGFGNLRGEFWLGNDFLSLMTSQPGKYRLRIDMTSSTNETRYAVYQNFAVGDESTKYRLSIGEYFGTAGDSGKGLLGQNNKKFTTYDNDNDELSSGNCATKWGGGGGFWYKSCDYVNLNGAYLTPGLSDDHGIEWEAWLVDKSLKATEMKFRPMYYP